VSAGARRRVGIIGYGGWRPGGGWMDTVAIQGDLEKSAGKRGQGWLRFKVRVRAAA
jgi:hypothetical protein